MEAVENVQSQSVHFAQGTDILGQRAVQIVPRQRDFHHVGFVTIADDPMPRARIAFEPMLPLAPVWTASGVVEVDEGTMFRCW